MLPVIVDRYHTGAHGWPVRSMVTVKIYDNGTYIGNCPNSRDKINYESMN